MAAHGGRNDCIQLDTGDWACRWIWLEVEPHGDPVETITLLGCTHRTEAEAYAHINDATYRRVLLVHCERKYDGARCEAETST